MHRVSRHNTTYQRIMFNENASFRRVFLQIPCKTLTKPMKWISYFRGLQVHNGGENASCFDSSQPWREHNTDVFWTQDTNHLVILTSISAATNPPTRVNYVPKWNRHNYYFNTKTLFCIKLLHVSASKYHNQARMCEKSVMYTWTSHFPEINQNSTYSPHILAW